MPMQKTEQYLNKGRILTFKNYDKFGQLWNSASQNCLTLQKIVNSTADLIFQKSILEYKSVYSYTQSKQLSFQLL